MDEFDIANTCRICLKIHGTLLSLFRKRKGTSPYEKLLNKVKLNIEINNALPSFICSQCLIELETTVSFLEKCERSNEVLASRQARGLASSDDSCKHDLNLDSESLEIKSAGGQFKSSLHPESDNEAGNGKSEGVSLDVECCPRCGSARRCPHWAPPLTHTCHYCSKVFTRKFNFKLHIKRHLGERDWSCPTCGVRQLTRWLAERHCLPRPRRPCPVSGCGRTFTTNTNLNTHLRAHKGERPFECADCGKAFISKNTLNDHIRIHTGAKPYMCVVCGARFRTNKLTRHMLSHRPAHAAHAHAAHTHAHPTHAHATHTRAARTHLCSQCPARYSHKQSLNKHVRRHHAAAQAESSLAASGASAGGGPSPP